MKATPKAGADASPERQEAGFPSDPTCSQNKRREVMQTEPKGQVCLVKRGLAAAQAGLCKAGSAEKRHLHFYSTEPKSNRTDPERTTEMTQQTKPPCSPFRGSSAVWKCGITAFSSVRRRNIKASGETFPWQHEGGRGGSMTSLSSASRAQDRLWVHNVGS